MAEYKECYVAFIDILGFKNYINHAKCEEINEIFQSILEFNPNPLVKNDYLYGNIHITIMSDSIVVYIDSSIVDSFMALTDVCSQIQMRLLRRENPILVRGGIAKGTLYHNDRILFGKGLTDAYILESTIACYPRIVFTEALLNEARDNNMGKLYLFDYNQKYYKKDSDELFYIDFLNTFNYLPTIKPQTVEESNEADNAFFKKITDFVTNELTTEINASVRTKYLWLKGKIISRIECMDQVKKYFDELKEQEQNNRMQRFIKSLENDECNN